MDIFENRRRWLARWIDTEYGSNKAQAALATGYSRSQISQFLSSTYQDGKSPQEKAARRLEKAFGKPERSMDEPFPGDEAATQQVSNAQPAPAYVLAARRALEDAYNAGVPREAFDAVHAIFSLLVASRDANIKPSQKSETMGPPPQLTASQSIRERATWEEREAETYLESRGGGSVEPRRRAAGRGKGKGARH